MVATGRTLYPLLERNRDGDMGTRLSEKVEWRVLGVATEGCSNRGLISCHRHGTQMAVYHEQQLKLVVNAQLDKHIHGLVMQCERGGFVFTSSRAKRCYAELVGGISGPIGDEDADDADEVPEGSSNTSAEIGTISNLDQSTGHLSASSSVYSQDSR